MSITIDGVTYDDIHFSVYDRRRKRSDRYHTRRPLMTFKMWEAMNVDGVRYTKILYGTINGVTKKVSQV